MAIPNGGLNGWWRLWLIGLVMIWVYGAYQFTIEKRLEPQLGMDGAVGAAGEYFVREGFCSASRPARVNQSADPQNPYEDLIEEMQSGGAPSGAFPVPGGVQVDFRFGSSIHYAICLKPGTPAAVRDRVKAGYSKRDDAAYWSGLLNALIVDLARTIGLSLGWLAIAIAVRWVYRGFTGTPTAPPG